MKNKHKTDLASL